MAVLPSPPSQNLGPKVLRKSSLRTFPNHWQSLSADIETEPFYKWKGREWEEAKEERGGGKGGERRRE